MTELVEHRNNHSYPKPELFYIDNNSICPICLIKIESEEHLEIHIQESHEKQ